MISTELVETQVKRCDICGKVIHHDSDTVDSIVFSILGFSDWRFKFRGDCCRECMSKIRTNIGKYINSLIPCDSSNTSDVYDKINADKILALKEILKNDKMYY